MIDPQDPEAYRSAVLRWDELADPIHADMLDFYRSVIALRAREPELRDHSLAAVNVDYDEDEQWVVVHRGSLRVLANVSGETRDLPVAATEVLFETAPTSIKDGSVQLAPHAAAVVRAG
jgi:maltooligosyltrehalose trehalohydrolase